GTIIINLLIVMGAIGSMFVRPTLAMSLIEIIVLITLSALVFFAGGLFLIPRLAASSDEGETDVPGMSNRVTRWLPAVSAVLPFLLIVAMIANVPLSSTLPVFGLCLLMIVLLHGLIRIRRLDVLSPVAGVSLLIVQGYWHVLQFTTLDPWPSMIWYGVFYGFFLLFPFLFREEMIDRKLPWISSAAAGIGQLVFFYDGFTRVWGDGLIGLLPAVLAGITLGAVYYIVRQFDEGTSFRRWLLALYGGVALFFVTLIFPLQLEKQWLTISWSLEAVALLWLHRRIPHEGLRLWSGALLLISFLRLTLNPAVFDSYGATWLPILNWYLYTYGIVTVCMFVAARMIDRPPEHWGRTRGKRWFPVMGTILAFYLLNIEIADYFSAGRTPRFELSASLAQDMTYSLAWALFALVVMFVGIKLRDKWARRGSLGLFLVTIVKVFLYDLWRLGQLYRVASLVGLSVVLILVSFVYQKYLSEDQIDNET
ncbi:MAG: DUF2339 domain-containing protein, partial [bacterium]